MRCFRRFAIQIALLSMAMAQPVPFIGSNGDVNYSVTNDDLCNIQIQVTSRGIVLTGEIEDAVVDDCRMTDLDNDDNPELFLFLSAELNLFAYEVEKQVLARISIPLPPADLLPFYRSKDSYKVEANKLVRIFPAYAEMDGEDNPSIGRYSIAYKYMNNSLVTEKVELLDNKPGLYSHELKIKVESIELNDVYDELTKSDIFSGS